MAADCIRPANPFKSSAWRRDIRRHSRIPQPRPEPLLDFLHAHSLPLGIVFNLIFLQFGKREVVAFRMLEIQPADRRPRMHCAAFREINSRRIGGSQ